MDVDQEVLDFIEEINEMNLANNQNIQDIILAHNALPMKRKYTVQTRIDPFQIYDEVEFKRRYRLTKAQVNTVYNLIDGDRTLESLIVRENFTIDGMTKLLVALRFYAVGCFAEPLADMFGISKSSSTAIVTEVSFLISYKLKERFIGFPNDEMTILNAKSLFYRFDSFPLAIGAVDGTNIKVQSFGGDNAEYYRNRKGYFSINCQVISSADVSKSQT